MRDVVIVSACRTAIGDFAGSLSSISATDLGAIVIREAVRRAGIRNDDIDEVIFAMFFTLAGAHFDLGVIREAGILSILIIFGRCGGKYIGARIGAVISHSSVKIKKYLGLGLMPKAGVTVGLALLAKQYFESSGVGNIMLSAILTSVIINELIAPPLTKYALIKAGEVSLEK